MVACGVSDETEGVKPEEVKPEEKSKPDEPVAKTPAKPVVCTWVCVFVLFPFGVTVCVANGVCAHRAELYSVRDRWWHVAHVQRKWQSMRLRVSVAPTSAMAGHAKCARRRILPPKTNAVNASGRKTAPPYHLRLHLARSAIPQHYST